MLVYDTLRQYLNQFYRMSDEEWSSYQRFLFHKELKRNDFLLQAGQIEKFIYFIVKGGIRVFYLKNEKDYSIRFGFEHEYVSSYASFLTQSPSRKYLQALEDTELICISKQSLDYLYANYKIGETIGRKIAEGLYIGKIQRESSLLLDSPDERYLKLREQRGDWFLRVPQHYIASYLNMSPETLSRVKKRNQK